VKFRYFREKQAPRFAHESEREAVTPDFYLPEAGLYIECTEMKSSLATRKRRKLRKLRALYGEVVTLVGRSEFALLRAKYGQARRSR
jgi:hypothetical protein